MTAPDQFNALVLSLAKRWGIDATAPIAGFTVRFESGENSMAMLRLDDEKPQIVLGIESSPSDQCNGALDTLGMRIFMLRRIYSARFGSGTRYGLRSTSNRIAIFQSLPLPNADIEHTNAVLAAMSVRLSAMKDVAALFTPMDEMLAVEGRSKESQHA